MTLEEKKERQREIARKWYHRHKEKAQENSRKYYHKHAAERIAYHNNYTKTPMGRASYLVQAYDREDKKYNRGECDFDAKWMVENIFTKQCAYCGETDWTKLGCNRLDNSKPHTKDNVEPCCGKCNLKLQETNRNNLGQFIS